MNVVVIEGRLTKDIQYSLVGENKTPKAVFTLALDRPTKNAEGKRDADFPRVIAWNKNAEFVNKYSSGGGGRVLVHGRLQTGSYVDKAGNTVYTTDVIADDIEVIDWKQTQPAAAPASGDAAAGSALTEADEPIPW